MGRLLAVFVVTRLVLWCAAAAPWPPDCERFDLPAPDDPTGVTTKEVGWRRDAAGAPVKGAWGRNFILDPSKPWLDAFVRWDAQFYFAVAAFGYRPEDSVPPGEVPIRAGFLPGYALLVRWTACALNAGVATATAAPEDARGLFRRFADGFALPVERPWLGVLAALLVSNAAFFAALLLLRRFGAALASDPAVGDRAALWACVAPTSFFFSAALSESLFLLLSTACLWRAHRRRFVSACALGGLAAFTRPVGLFLVVPLFFAALERRSDRAQVARDVFKMALVPAGFAAACALMKHETGRFDAYFLAQAQFGHDEFPTLDGLLRLFQGTGKTPTAFARDVIQAAALLFAAGLLVKLGVAARRHAAWRAPLAWALVSVAFPLLADDVISLPRYLAATFPLYLGAALTLPAGRAGVALGALAVVGQAVAFAFFARHWPVFI